VKWYCKAWKHLSLARQRYLHASEDDITTNQNSVMSR
jgi:hypothetical protein